MREVLSFCDVFGNSNSLLRVCCQERVRVLFSKSGSLFILGFKNYYIPMTIGMIAFTRGALAGQGLGGLVGLNNQKIAVFTKMNDSDCLIKIFYIF